MLSLIHIHSFLKGRIVPATHPYNIFILLITLFSNHNTRAIDWFLIKSKYGAAMPYNTEAVIQLLMDSKIDYCFHSLFMIGNQDQHHPPLQQTNSPLFDFPTRHAVKRIAVVAGCMRAAEKKLPSERVREARKEGTYISLFIIVGRATTTAYVRRTSNTLDRPNTQRPVR